MCKSTTRTACPKTKSTTVCGHWPTRSTAAHLGPKRRQRAGNHNRAKACANRLHERPVPKRSPQPFAGTGRHDRQPRIGAQRGAKELVTITVPKHVQIDYTNGLSQNEVHNRLRALADTIDSRGW